MRSPWRSFSQACGPSKWDLSTSSITTLKPTRAMGEIHGVAVTPPLPYEMSTHFLASLSPPLYSVPRSDNLKLQLFYLLSRCLENILTHHIQCSSRFKFWWFISYSFSIILHRFCSSSRDKVMKPLSNVTPVSLRFQVSLFSMSTKMPGTLHKRYFFSG